MTTTERTEPTEPTGPASDRSDDDDGAAPTARAVPAADAAPSPRAPRIAQRTITVPDLAPYARQYRDMLASRGPVLVLGAAIAYWFVAFARLIVWRHDRFGSFDFDLGIWDQATWLLAHGSGFDTVRGLPVFAHHATPALYLYAPFYWLGAGSNFLNVTMVAAFCAGTIAIYQAARHHLRNEWHAVVVALAFLVNFVGQWLMQETFHPEVMAIPFFLFAYVAAIKGKWRNYAILLVFAMAWKEDIALVATMLGVVLAIRGRRTVTGALGPALTRRVGLLTMLGAGLYFVFATQWLIPHFSPAGNFTEGFFGDLGTSTLDIVKSMFTQPDVVRAHFAQSDPGGYFQQLAAGFGYVSVLSPLPLLIGLPGATVNLLTNQNFFWSLKVHYAVAPLIGMALAATEGAARFKRVGLRRFVLGVLAVGTFFTAVTWGISPFSKDFRQGYWPLEPAATQAAYDEAVAMPGPDDAVSALYLLVPHLTHRQEIYTFPNPWIASNWGVAGENRPNPDDVDWIMVNPTSLSETDRGVLARALADPRHLLHPGDEVKPAPAVASLASLANPAYWTVVRSSPDLLVVRRVR